MGSVKFLEELPSRLWEVLRRISVSPLNTFCYLNLYPWEALPQSACKVLPFLLLPVVSKYPVKGCVYTAVGSGGKLITT